MRHYKLLLILALIMTKVLPALASSDDAVKPVASQIVENIVTAYGGHNALEAVKALKHSGTIQSYRLARTGTLQRLLVLPGALRVDIAYPDGPHEIRITTPDGAWRDGSAATGPMHKAMKLQAARFQLPLILTQHVVTLLDDVDGKIQLGITLDDTTTLQVIVDRQSWRIVRSVGNMKMGSTNLAFTADYSDFRKVDGVLLAHREELTAMGMKTGVVVLEHIDVNPVINADELKP